MTSNLKPTLLDGGMGQEIVNRGGKSAYGEWAVAALYDDPQMVKAIHIDYIEAGADVITTNTYSTTRTRLRHVGMEDRFEELIRRAGKLATEARDETQATHVQIAASLSPLEATYINEFTLSFDEMVAQYQEIMTLLDAYVDIYLGETFSTTLESRAFLTAAQNTNKPTWVSWTLHDHGSTTLRGSETIQQALDSIRSFSVDALLINCCTPDSILAAFPLLDSSGIQFGGYANGFVEIPSSWDINQVQSRTDLAPDVYAQHIKNWLEAGATIVGGCCEIGPAHIARVRQMLDKA